MKKILLFTILAIFSSSLYANPLDFASDDTETKGMSTGVKLMHFDNYDGEEFYAGVIPSGEYLYQVGPEGMYLSTGTNLTWGLTDFFFDFCLTGGFRYYPLNNKYFSLYTGGDVGTFIFNNATTTGRVGFDIEVPANDEFSTFMGAEYFSRKSYRLIEFIESEHWYITSRGWAINGGFRVKIDIFKDGIQGIPRTL